MGELQQISASVHKDTVKSINKIAENEKRSFSSMVDILLAEASKIRLTKIKK